VGQDGILRADWNRRKLGRLTIGPQVDNVDNLHHKFAQPPVA
jgi:hypothetical protein